MWFFVACSDPVGTSDADIEVTATGATCPMPCSESPRCSAGEVASCCACVDTPTEGATRCGSEICSASSGSGEIDLSCFNDDPWTDTDIPGELVRLMGLVDVFSTGGDTSRDILVEVYLMDDETTLGTLIGEFVTGQDEVPCEDREDVLAPFLVESDAEAEMCSGSCSSLISESLATCRKLGFFMIDDVPTHVPIVIVTSGDDSWRSTYIFNVILSQDNAVEITLGEGAPTPTIVTDVHALADDDFYWLALQSGLNRAIPETHGVVIGEVRDCQDVRVRNAQVGFTPEPALTTYFNGVEAELTPDGVRRHGTNWVGRYAGLDIDPEDNPVRISAVGLVGDQVVSLGWATARVYPGSLTIVDLSGSRPGVDVFPGSTDVP